MPTDAVFTLWWLLLYVTGRWRTRTSNLMRVRHALQWALGNLPFQTVNTHGITQAHASPNSGTMLVLPPAHVLLCWCCSGPGNQGSLTSLSGAAERGKGANEIAPAVPYRLLHRYRG